MSESSHDEEPKLIIDEDWKEQVQREKEALRAAQPGTQSQADASDSTSEAADPPALPDASLETLISMIYTQAIAALGLLPGPQGEPTRVDKVIAKHYIDTLDVLEQKTSGNRTAEETQILSEALHHARMAFVSVKATSPTSPIEFG